MPRSIGVRPLARWAFAASLCLFLSFGMLVPDLYRHYCGMSEPNPSPTPTVITFSMSFNGDIHATWRDSEGIFRREELLLDPHGLAIASLSAKTGTRRYQIIDWILTLSVSDDGTGWYGHPFPDGFTLEDCFAGRFPRNKIRMLTGYAAPWAWSDRESA